MGNREVVTGGDFKRMFAGAYSEFLLEYEKINALQSLESGTLPGTHILRTLSAAGLPLATTKDNSLGGLSRRVATAAVFGARGHSGVVLAQLFRGLAKGFMGKYDATSSEFGKAFQYGILYAQRAVPELPERSFITVAKAVAKGAYRAVRAASPVTDILSAARLACENAAVTLKKNDAGAKIMLTFLTGCLKGLDGNFVSPVMSLKLGLTADLDNLPDPKSDVVKPYCLIFTVENNKLDLATLEKELKDYGNFALVEANNRGVRVHLHTDCVGNVLDQAVGWGKLSDVNIVNMGESHTLAVHDAIMPVAALAVAETSVEAERLQEAGAGVIVKGSAANCPSVAEIVGAAHSDFAQSYVLTATERDFRLVFREVKRLLGERVEIVLCPDKDSALVALNVFDGGKSAAENAECMRQSVARFRNADLQ